MVEPEIFAVTGPEDLDDRVVREVMALVVDLDDVAAFRAYSADEGHQQILNELILPAGTRLGVQYTTE